MVAENTALVGLEMRDKMDEERVMSSSWWLLNQNF